MKENSSTEIKIRNDLFPPSLFVVYLLVLTLMSGVHTGLIVGMNKNDWSDIAQTLVPLLYWAAVAVGLTIFTRIQIQRTYEGPMHRLAKATEQVAGGDFSVRIPPVHTSGKLDYMDIMLADFNKMVAELSSIEILKNDFVSNVSHEIKTPLAVIQNYATLLQESDLTEQQRREYADVIFNAAGQLSVLVTNILRLSKLENQAITPKPHVYNLCGQLVDCILNFETQIETGQIDFSIDMEDQAMVLADEELVELIWNNLLSNAIKFTPAGGTVTLVQKTEGNTVTVSVSDTGCGMNAETIKHIFDKFYQGDTSHFQKGNGLGLALVKKVIDIVHGEITVTSQPGNGSTFTVSLPKGAEDEN